MTRNHSLLTLCQAGLTPWQNKVDMCLFPQNSRYFLEFLNAPPIHMADNLGKKVMNRIFKNKSWNFIKQYNKKESTNVKRKKNE